MPDNQFRFTLQASGLENLTLTVVAASGGVTLPGPFPVTEVPGDPGLYQATFSGPGTNAAPIAYSVALRYQGQLLGWGTANFLWDGANFIYPLTLTRSQSAAAAAIASTPIVIGDNAITAAKIASNAITAAKIADGAITAAKFGVNALAAVWTNATRTLTAIADSTGVTTLLTRATEARLAKLDVAGTLAHSGDAANYRATGFATPANITDAQSAIINHGNNNWATATGFATPSELTPLATAAQLTAATSGLSTLTGGDIGTALATYQAAKIGDVQITVNPTPVTVDGGFGPDAIAALDFVSGEVKWLTKRQGRGGSARVKDAAPGVPGYLITSGPEPINQALTLNEDGELTITENA